MSEPTTHGYRKTVDRTGRLRHGLATFGHANVMLSSEAEDSGTNPAWDVNRTLGVSTFKGKARRSHGRPLPCGKQPS